MKKVISLLIFVGIAASIFAADIQFASDPEEFLIFNRRNSKIYNYFKLKPNETVSCRLINIDTLEVYSRVIIQNAETVQYNYQVQIAGEKINLEKSANASEISRGVNGEGITSYNKYATKILKGDEQISIKNTSRNNLVFKLSGKNIVSSNKEIDYIRFTPNFYGDVKTLLINEKEYTYYVPKSDKIQLTLEGPIVLKIISRMIFDTNYINNSGYLFRVLDNREMFGEFTEKAYKSKNSWILNEQHLVPSTGDVNILKFSKGIHHITIENTDNNKDLIFRFYINKDSVEIEKQ